MANHTSAKKRIRRNARRAAINGARMSRIRTFVRWKPRLHQATAMLLVRRFALPA